MWNAILLSLVTAIYYVLLRRMSTTDSPFLLGTAFRLVCLLLFSIFFTIRGQWRQLLSKQVLELLPWLLLIASCNFLLESATIIGLRLTTALNAALLSRVDIVFAIAIGATFFGERPRKADLWGIALLTSGSLAVLNVHLGSISSHVVGDLLIVAAGLLIAFNAFVIRFKLASLENEVIAFHNVLYSTIPFAIAACWETRFFSFAATNLALIGILGLVTFGNYVIYYAALRRMTVWRIRTLLLAVPALVLFAGVLFLRDPLTVGQLLGAILVLVGELVALISAKNRALETVPIASTG
jgi:drug/metabolite transporter (DMT)-like permease